MYLSEEIEKQIQTLLKKKKSSEQIATLLLKKKITKEDPDAFLQVCRFMHQSKLYKLLFQTAINRLSKKEIVPWGFLIEILDTHKIKITTKQKNLFLEGIIKQNQIPSMLTSQSWDQELPQFAKQKLELISRINKKNNRQVEKLIKDLEFIKTLGILEKEEEILKKLRQLDPENPEIQDRWLSFREKKGRHIIQQRKAHLLTKNPLPASPCPQEQEQAKKILKFAKGITKSNPEKSYDFALLFSFIGYPELAVQLLKNRLHSFSAEWFYVDVLLQSKLYLDCLTFTDIMEMKYSDNPETAFALAYARAKAYYGLGEKEKAKNILSDLLTVRPNYRLANLLLAQWKKGIPF